MATGTRPEQLAGADTVVGGLDTKNPAHALEPKLSPDLLNVVLANNSIRRRGGFVPLIKSQPKINSILNQGYHAKGADNTISTDHDVLACSGC